MHDYESRVGIHIIKAPLGIRIACHTALIPIGGATLTKQIGSVMYVVETWAVRAMMWIHVHVPCTLCSMYLLYVAADQAARIWGGG
jgi:hypothetical protein